MAAMLLAVRVRSSCWAMDASARKQQWLQQATMQCIESKSNQEFYLSKNKKKVFIHVIVNIFSHIGLHMRFGDDTTICHSKSGQTMKVLEWFILHVKSR